MIPGNVLILKGKTNKGKNRIREFGNRWVILRIHKTDILIAAENDRSGNDLPDSSRWTHSNDKDFEIVQS